VLGGGGAHDHAFSGVEEGRADRGDLAGALGAGVDDLGDALAVGAAEIEYGELVQVADLAALQALGGRGGGEVAARDGGQGLLEIVHVLRVRGCVSGYSTRAKG
jgi:hypothetical protein